MNRKTGVIALIAASLSLVSTFTSAHAITEIRIGTEGAFAPYNNLNSKKELEGFEIDYMNDLCARMKVKCTWVVQDWDGIVPALLSKKYDVIVAGMNATPERAKRVDFTDPYVVQPVAGMVIGLRAIPNDDISPATLKGKNVGAQGSTIHMNFLEAHYKGSNLRPYPTQDEATLDLLTGRLDYVVGEAEGFQKFLQVKGAECCRKIAFVPRDPFTHGPGIAMAVRKGDDALRSLLNKAIAESKADGSLNKHAEKWLGKKAIQ